MPPNKKNKISFLETIKKGHGRIDHREYQVLSSDVLPLNTIAEWNTIKSIGIARTTSIRRNKKSIEIRYYIMSFEQDAERFAKAARGHWAVENKVHWTLDVTFGEDQSRVRKDRAPQNFSLIRKLAMNILRAEKSIKNSLPQKMIIASLNKDYHEKLLRLTGF